MALAIGSAEPADAATLRRRRKKPPAGVAEGTLNELWLFS